MEELDKNKTIAEILAFKRPLEVYREKYRPIQEKSWYKKLGIIPSLVFSLLAVALLAWLLHSVEAALTAGDYAPENVDLEEVTQERMNFSGLARKFLGVATAYAAEPDLFIRDSQNYKAQYIAQSIADPVEIEAGTTKTVVFKFKNQGAAVWDILGNRFISAYTVEPQYRQSKFQGNNWLSVRQTAKVKGVVKPGEIGELELQLTAPLETGDYIEKFFLAAENYSWADKGYFYVKIKVVPPAVSVKTAIAPKQPAGEYAGQRLILSKKSVRAAGGEEIKIIVGYQNQGQSSWRDFSLTAAESVFFAPSWLSGQVVLSGAQEVSPDGFLRQVFYFRAPPQKGQYSARFVLSIDGGSWTDEIIIPLAVTADAPAGYAAPPAELVKAKAWLGEEPRIRVGIAAPAGNFLQFRSYDDDYHVFDGETRLGVLAKGKFAVIKLSEGKYKFNGGGLAFTAEKYVRLEPASDPRAGFYVLNLVRQAGWVSGENFNQYRGAVEYRQGEVDKKMYIVNDLLLEDYVKGMAEVSRADALEFVKANVVAFRTYAYVNKGNYPFFDVIANTYDQLYLGVWAEKVLPNVVEAAGATRGLLVTYNGEIVTTPYFGRSNGWTRSWFSVWGGKDKPWLTPVRTEYDAGYSRLGHGVGLSQRDANLRAKNQGLDFISLLKYYYTDVAVERVYD